MKTLDAKPFDQNAENWKRENRLFTSTVLEAGALGAKSNRYARTQKSSNSLIRFHCSNSRFFLETGIAGHERLLLAKWHPKSEKKPRKRPFFDSADRHEKLYGRSRLYASAQGRHETAGVLSLFSSLSFDISIQNSVQRWSSDFQGLFLVKIRKMAQGSIDLSTLDPPPPLDLSFWSFLTFLHHGIEEVERHLLWKFYKKIRRKSWLNVPPKLVACIGFLYKVVHKIGRLRKFNRSRGI